MRHGYKIIDADRHVLEPIDMWEKYLPAQFREHAPYHQVLAQESLRDRVERLGAAGAVPVSPETCIDGAPLWTLPGERARIELNRVAMHRHVRTRLGASPEGQLAAMDEEGVDIAFLFPTITHYLLAIDDMDARLSAAFARAYNQWLCDFCRVDPGRLRGIGVVSRHDPGDMLTELERIVDAGLAAVVLRPNPIKGRILSDPAYEPFWGACERHGVAVCIHEGTHARVSTVGADRFHTRFAQHACSHPMEQMMALLALIEGGVLERHPGLRVGIFEAGCGWLPYWLWRLDELEYASMAAEVAENVRMRPSAYVRRQCFIAFEPEEPYLGALIDFIGADLLLFGTDFPHYDHDADIVESVMGLQGTLSARTLSAVLWNNPARLFGVT